jgi:small subunit ribosomal protein S16
VAQVGTYDPHSKAVTLNKDRAQHYLDHGAQPTGRVVVLFKNEGLKLPAWVKLPTKQDGKIRNADKLRRNQPKAVAAPAEAEAPVEDAPAEEPAAETADTTETSEA